MSDRRLTGSIESLLRARLKNRLKPPSFKGPVDGGEGIALGAEPLVPAVPLVPADIAFSLSVFNYDTSSAHSVVIMRDSTGVWVRLDPAKIATYYGAPTFGSVPQSPIQWIGAGNAVAAILHDSTDTIWFGPGLSYNFSTSMGMTKGYGFCKIGLAWVLLGFVSGVLVIRYSTDPLNNKWVFSPGLSFSVIDATFNSSGTKGILTYATAGGTGGIVRFDLTETTVTASTTVLDIFRLDFDPDDITPTIASSTDIGTVGSHLTTCVDFDVQQQVCLLTREEHVPDTRTVQTILEYDLYWDGKPFPARIMEAAFSGDQEIVATEFLTGSNIVTRQSDQAHTSTPCAWEWINSSLDQYPLGPNSMFFPLLPPFGGCADANYGCIWVYSIDGSSLWSDTRVSLEFGANIVSEYRVNPTSAFLIPAHSESSYYEIDIGYEACDIPQVEALTISSVYPVEVPRAYSSRNGICVTMEGDRGVSNSLDPNPGKVLDFNIQHDGIKTVLFSHALYDGNDTGKLLRWNANLTQHGVSVVMESGSGGFKNGVQDRVYSLNVQLDGKSATSPLETIFRKRIARLSDGDFTAITGINGENATFGEVRYIVIDKDEAQALKL